MAIQIVPLIGFPELAGLGLDHTHWRSLVSRSQRQRRAVMGQGQFDSNSVDQLPIPEEQQRELTWAD